MSKKRILSIGAMILCLAMLFCTTAFAAGPVEEVIQPRAALCDGCGRTLSNYTVRINGTEELDHRSCIHGYGGNDIKFRVFIDTYYGCRYCDGENGKFISREQTWEWICRHGGT